MEPHLHGQAAEDRGRQDEERERDRELARKRSLLGAAQREDGDQKSQDADGDHREPVAVLDEEARVLRHRGEVRKQLAAEERPALVDASALGARDHAPGDDAEERQSHRDDRQPVQQAGACCPRRIEP